MKKVLCITGTRADFSKLKPILNYLEIQDSIELHLLITGMHMMQVYGSTYQEVLRENYKHTYLISNQFSGEPMTSVLGNTITLISRLLHEIKPDMLIVHGDRLEALAGATVGSMSNCLVCHIEGGELSGTIDDSIRHAITKLAHIHLVANEIAKLRLQQMGENANSIYVIGSPDLDIMLSKNLPTLNQVKQHYNIAFQDYALSLFHPITTEVDNILEYASQYFEALEESQENYIVIYPNNDTGTEAILQQIKRIENNTRFCCFPSLRFEAFLVLLKNAKFIVGNSSAGIREAPFYGIPTVNVGSRQNKRLHTESIINTGYLKNQILDGIRQASYKDKYHPMTHFGEGNSVELFKKIIHNPDIWQTKIQKTFIDL